MGMSTPNTPVCAAAQEDTSPMNRTSQWVCGLSPNELPDAVHYQVRRTLLDGLGAAIAGTATRAGRYAAAFVHEHGKAGRATVLANGNALTAPNAILANVIAANAWDIDDGFRPSKGHPGGFVIMPALAAAQECGAAKLTTGIVAGYEISCRAAIATHRYYHHYHASGSWGALGTAATLGHMHGASQVQLEWAFGLAEYHAALSPIERCLGTPGMTKDAIGWGAYAGACAAHLAMLGFTGNPSLLDAPENADVMDDLGDTWHILNLYFKPYPCCRWAQQAVDALASMRASNDIALESIQHVTIHTFREATLLQQTPPRTTEEAQYHLFWALAAALAYGDVSVEHVADENLNDPTLLELLGRMNAVVEPDIQRRFPTEALCWIEIACVDGRVLRSDLTAARGDAHIPLTDQELETKFHKIVEPVAGDVTGELLTIISDWGSIEAAEALLKALPRVACVPV